MATKTKTGAKRATKTTATKTGKRASAKPTRGAAKSTKSTKSTGKTGTAKSTAKKPPATRTVTVTSAAGNARKIARPVAPVQFGSGGSVRVPQFAAAAEIASTLACTDADGQPTNRARIGTVQVQRVHEFIGRRRPADVLATIMRGPKPTSDAPAKSKTGTLARQYADGKLGQTELPDGARERLSAMAKSIGDPRKTKINGRALMAVLVGLATAK